MKVKSWRDLILPAWEYYHSPGNSVGGRLHVVLDDGNIDDSHVASCLRNSQGYMDVWVDGLPPADDPRQFGPGATGRWEEVFRPEERDEAGVALCDLLLASSRTQRDKLTRNYHLYCHGSPRPTVAIVVGRMAAVDHAVARRIE